MPVAGVVGRWPVGSSWASFGIDVDSDSAEQADVSLCADEMWARSCSSTRRTWPRNRSTARPRYSVIPGTHAVRPAPRPRTHRGSTPDPPSCQHNHHGRSRPRLNRAPGPSVELWRCFAPDCPATRWLPGDADGDNNTEFHAAPGPRRGRLWAGRAATGGGSRSRRVGPKGSSQFSSHSRPFTAVRVTPVPHCDQR